MSNDVTEYLSRLLNKTVDAGTEITLSSAQRARLHAWLTNNQIAFDEAILSKRFTVSDLLSGNSNFQVQQNEFRQVNSLNSSIADHPGSMGIDIQRIDELFPNGLPTDPKSDPDLTSIFTINELSYAQSKDNPKETLVGIYCAKEALLKAGYIASQLNQVEIGRDNSGAPCYRDFLISISHSGNYAIAVAVKAPDCIGDVRAYQTESLESSFRKFRKIDFFYFLMFFLLISMVVLNNR